MIQFDIEQIKKLAPHAHQDYLDAFGRLDANTVLAKYGMLDNPLRLCHFIAQSMTETGGLHTRVESLNYSATRLMEVWPKHFHSLLEAEPYAHDEEKLGSFIYGQTSIAAALGNTEPGDGFKYRGRGLMQITGRSAYTQQGKKLDIDLVSNPDLAFGSDNSLDVAGIEWQSSGYHGKSCNQLADNDDISGVIFAINGGQTGIEDRKIWLKRAKDIWMPAHTFAGGSNLASRAIANFAFARTATGGGVAANAVEIAIGEWMTFGQQRYNASGQLVHAGHKEGEDPWYKRVGDYWHDGVHNNTLDGRDHGIPWSAAFISWVMRTAGAGTKFSYSPQHSVYVYQAIRDLQQGREEAGFWCYRLQEWKPRSGDIVCWSRETDVDYDHQQGGDYKGHCDVIIGVNEQGVEIVGGNVGDSVTRRPLALNSSGYLEPAVQGGERLFGIMRCRIGEATEGL